MSLVGPPTVSAHWRKRHAAPLSSADISISFGGIRAVNNVSLAVTEGEMFAIVGPNGAGKITIFNLVSRFYEPTGGGLLVQGTSISNDAADTIAGPALPAPSRTSSCSSG